VTIFLLDANVLIALTVREHVHHEHVTRWAEGVRRFAVCPVVEGALIRFTLRLGGRAADALQLLSLVRDRTGYEFWPDSLSYADAQLEHVQGHRQVTDAYLASLARARPGGFLATLDAGLAQAWPEAVFLVPNM
jgi:toxin-antitoxin system PIN domain toxin